MMDGNLPSYPTLPPQTLDEQSAIDPVLFSTADSPHSLPTSTHVPLLPISAAPPPSLAYSHTPLIPLPPPQTHPQPSSASMAFSDPTMGLVTHPPTILPIQPMHVPTSGYGSGSPQHSTSIATPPSSLQMSSHTLPTLTTSSEPIYSTVVKKKPTSASTMGRSSPPTSFVQTPPLRPRVATFTPTQTLPPSFSPDNSSDEGTLLETKLSLRIQYLESLCVSFQKEKKAMKEEFDRQRKSFMKHLTQTEDELNLAKETIEKFSTEVQELSTQLLYKDEEVKNIEMAVQLNDRAMREAYDADRVKYEEEIASLQKIIKEEAQDHQMTSQQQKAEWLTEREAIILQLTQLRAALGMPPPMIPREPVMAAAPQQVHNPKDSLEASMLKAAQDTEMLRAVVLPLEKEIEMLKSKLKEAEEQLKSSEEDPMSDSLIDLNLSLDSPLKPAMVANDRDIFTPSPTSTENKAAQLQHQLELERSARHDLEMHTEQLKVQKSILQKDLSDLQGYVERVRSQYDRERVTHTELKKTWELANRHFIVSQDQLNQRIYQLEQQLAEKASGEKSENQSESTSEPDSPIVMKMEGEREGEGEAREGHMPRSRSSEFDSQLSPTSSSGLQSGSGRSASWTSLSTIAEEKRVADLEKELTILQKELSRKVEMVGNYEAQLQRVQEQMVADMDEKERTIDRLRAEIEKFKANMMREKRFRTELRREIVQAKEEMKTTVEKFEVRERDLAQALRSIRERFTEAKHDAQREVARFADERVRLYSQIEHSREEYDCLKVLQSQNVGEYHKKFSEETRARQLAETNMATSLEEVSALRARMAEVEDDLCNQVAALKEQVLTEQSEKEKMETSLTVQLVEARRELVELYNVREDIEREREAKEEAVTARVSIQEKSRAFIEGQQRQLEQLLGEKERAEQLVRDLQRQLSLLRTQLNSTEETQKDFVELSQTLQVRIAKMEETQQERR